MKTGKKNTQYHILLFYTHTYIYTRCCINNPLDDADGAKHNNIKFTWPVVVGARTKIYARARAYVCTDNTAPNYPHMSTYIIRTHNVCPLLSWAVKYKICVYIVPLPALLQAEGPAKSGCTRRCTRITMKVNLWYTYMPAILFIFIIVDVCLRRCRFNNARVYR